MSIDKSSRRGEQDVSVWDEGAAAKYAAAKHGPDGAKFLDPHLYALMSRNRLEGSNFLDLGGGAGPWSAHALGQGARAVTNVDLNQAMLDQARERLSFEGVLPQNVNLLRSNVADLALSARQFDRLASINVGCNLPDGVFQRHFSEAKRVAQPGARFVVTAPDSLVVPFTTGDQSRDIQDEIDDRWRLESASSSPTPKSVIDSLRSVLRATFVLDSNGKPVLITDENAELVEEGTPIIRRIPGLAVDNNFHTAEAYIQAAEEAGWVVSASHRGSFESEDARIEHNATVDKDKQLGPEYVSNPSFLVMDLENAA